MLLNIDAAILLLFLLTNLIVGLHYGKGVRTFQTYATGGRKFSNTAVTATIVATWISGSVFAFNLSGVYTEGLPFVIIMLGNPLALAIIGMIYVPRMAEFQQARSLSHVMGKLYGSKVQYITAICGIWLSAGVVGLQIKLLSNVLAWSFGITDSLIASVIATSVVIVYSAFGGIRSVTFTDIVQSITFSALIPSLCIVLWHSMSSPNDVFTMIETDPRFQWSELFKLKWLSLFIWSVIPWLGAAGFQRILIAKNLMQARKTFINSAIITFVITALTSWIAILLLSMHREFDPEKLVLHILDDYSFVGLRGLIIAGIAAMVMGSADSYIHSAAVQFANDLPSFSSKPLSDHEKLMRSRVFAVFMGILGFIIPLSQKSLLDLALLVTNFYIPIVTVPLTLAILGFRSTSRSVLVGMAVGFAVSTYWYLFYTAETGIDSAAPGMVANLIAMMAYHYLTNQQGGWINKYDDTMLNTIRITRKHHYLKLIQAFKSFSLTKFVNDEVPSISAPYIQFGFFSIVSIFANMYALPHSLKLLYSEVLDPLYNLALMIAGIFLLYPLWGERFQKWAIRGILWNISIFLILVCFGGLLLVVSHFAQFASIILTIDLIVVCMLTRWQIALPMVFLGTLINYGAYHFLLGTPYVWNSSFIESPQLKILYGLLLFATFLIAFIKPKQESADKLQGLANALEQKALTMSQEARKALEVKMEFINNMNHEVRIPVQGVSVMAANLADNWDNISDLEKQQMARAIDQNAHRLFSLIDSILNFSDLASNKLLMHYSDVYVKDLIMDALDHCKRYHVQHEDQAQFAIDIESSDMKLHCDPRYMHMVLVNLFTNAVQYSNDGVVTITARHSHKRDEFGNDLPNTSAVEISVCDDGIGIPAGEEFAIFLPFMLSSYTHTKAGGRGIGLALAHLVIQQHDGSIWVENNKNGTGATFYIRV